jgi:hypothetical protein
MKVFIGILVLIGLIGSAFADTGCAAGSYDMACVGCPFDQYGKMDQTCYENHMNGGLACFSSKYPIASAAYANGKCSGIDSCHEELDSCLAQYQTGNDSADCYEDNTRSCFSAADQCMYEAAGECGDDIPLCSAPVGGFVGLFVLVGFLKMKQNN